MQDSNETPQPDTSALPVSKVKVISTIKPDASQMTSAEQSAYYARMETLAAIAKGRGVGQAVTLAESKADVGAKLESAAAIAKADESSRGQLAADEVPAQADGFAAREAARRAMSPGQSNMR